MIRQAYADATGLFVDTVAQVGDAQWEQPGLGVWTVRDLTGHTNRALLTVETYLAKPVNHIDLERPVDYFLQAMASLADPAAVAARGREAGQALGTDPASMVRDVATRVLAQLETVADEIIVGTPVGGMRLIDYLPTRIFELTVHTLDIAAILPVEISIPDTAARVSLQLLMELALQPGKTAPLLVAATGRRPLPAGYSVL
jgi:uncharacterized protein (TIGR03083 family)